jgi:hypothetical protein
MRTAVARLVAAVLLVPGCSHDNALPAVAVTAVPTAAAAACARFADRLPESLGNGLPRRDTVPRDPHIASYGDPPVVVRCGAPRTTAYRAGDQLFEVNGVRWFAEERAREVVWSLPRAFVNVEVTVPRAWTGDRLALLSPAVEAAQRR